MPNPIEPWMRDAMLAILTDNLATDATRWRDAGEQVEYAAAILAAHAPQQSTKVGELRIALGMALEWEREYRSINNLGKVGPYWVEVAEEALLPAPPVPAQPCVPPREQQLMTDAHNELLAEVRTLLRLIDDEPDGILSTALRAQRNIVRMEIDGLAAPRVPPGEEKQP